METLKEQPNYSIDWKSDTPKAHNERMNYLSLLRNFIRDLENLNIKEANDLMKHWKIAFVDVDEFPRVNLQ